MRARLDLAALSGRRLDDAVVLAFEQDAQHVADVGIVLDDEDLMHRDRHTLGSAAGSVNSKPRAAARAGGSGDRAAVRMDDRSADRQAKPDTDDGAFLNTALKLVEQALGISRRATGAVVVDGNMHRRRPRRAPSPLISVPAGVYFAALSNRFANTCTTSVASTNTSGKSARQGYVDAMGAEAAAALLQRSTDHVFERFPVAAQRDLSACRTA